MKKLDISTIKFNETGLVPVLAQDHQSGRVLMLAYMNQESLQMTFDSGLATYWSRSRKKLWRKGESSGNVQKVVAIHQDCDGDTLLLQIEQVGKAACHTGHESCFYRTAQPDGTWLENSKPLFDPQKVYKK